jgi:hypothetical protein
MVPGTDTRASRITNIQKAAGLALIDCLVGSDDPVGAQVICLRGGEEDRRYQHQCHPNEYTLFESLHCCPRNEKLPHKLFFGYLTSKMPFRNYKFVMGKQF